jgi:hypothetical protein
MMLVEQMRLADYDDDSYEFKWVNAPEAEYIISILVDKNKLPVVTETKPGHYETCVQFVMSLVLHKRVDFKYEGRYGPETMKIMNPLKMHEMMNQQVNCDPDDIAKRAVDALLTAMKLKKSDSLTKK